MSDINLEIDKIPYLYDTSGRIWINGNNVYRIIEDKESIENYKHLLKSPNIDKLFSCGLIETWIKEELLEKRVFILEHKRIPFILHPSEYTNQMFWKAACMFVEVNSLLWSEGFLTHDSHPWNISYDGSKPVFYDFGSIKKTNVVSDAWLNEFYAGFLVPIWLSNYSHKTFKFSKEYRREHAKGFALELFNSTKLKKTLFRKIRSFYKFRNNPERLFKELLKWLHAHEPLKVKPEYWSEYYKNSGLDYTRPENIKQKFVNKILQENKPSKVLDLASNKGYFAKMAAAHGAEVMAFDYEEEVVNTFISSENPMNMITPAHMDFNKPTSALGAGLFWENSFKRFNSNVVLALGLIHHICITQKTPVFLFCKTCMNYAEDGIILEFVDPEDIHVASWKKRIPRDYSIHKIKEFMKPKFPLCEISETDNKNGLNRVFLFFYKSGVIKR